MNSLIGFLLLQLFDALLCRHHLFTSTNGSATSDHCHIAVGFFLLIVVIMGRFFFVSYVLFLTFNHAEDADFQSVVHQMFDDLLVDLDHVRVFVAEVGSLTSLDYFCFMLGLVFVEPLVPCLSLVGVLLWDF